jgi:hypothetical protein
VVRGKSPCRFRGISVGSTCPGLLSCRINQAAAASLSPSPVPRFSPNQPEPAVGWSRLERGRSSSLAASPPSARLASLPSLPVNDGCPSFSSAPSAPAAARFSRPPPAGPIAQLVPLPPSAAAGAARLPPFPARRRAAQDRPEPDPAADPRHRAGARQPAILLLGRKADQRQQWRRRQGFLGDLGRQEAAACRRPRRRQRLLRLPVCPPAAVLPERRAHPHLSCSLEVEPPAYPNGCSWRAHAVPVAFRCRTALLLAPSLLANPCRPACLPLLLFALPILICLTPSSLPSPPALSKSPRPVAGASSTSRLAPNARPASKRSARC